MLLALNTGCLAGLLAIISGAQAQLPTTDYTFVNNCPTDIKLYRHNAFSIDLAKGANVTREESLSTGYFYTDVNGGGGYQTDPSTKFATYWAENDPKYYYYIVKNTTSFNTGMRIQPSHPEVDGFCQTVTCDAANCETAFPRRTVYTDMGPMSPTPPTEPPLPPLYSCPFEEVTYIVTKQYSDLEMLPTSDGQVSGPSRKPASVDRLAPEVLGIIFGFVHDDELEGLATATMNARLVLPGWIDIPEPRSRLRGDKGWWSGMEEVHERLLALVRSERFFPLSVSKVCKSWDTVVSMYSSFWTRVVLFVDEPYPPPPLTLEYFSRSRDRDLDVIITRRQPNSHRNPSTLDEALAINTYLSHLAPHLSRCRSLHIDTLLGSSLPSLGLNFKGSANRLNFFSLSCQEDDKCSKRTDRVDLWEAISAYEGHGAPLHFNISPKAMILDAQNFNAILRSAELHRWFCKCRQLAFLTIQTIAAKSKDDWTPSPDSHPVSLSKTLCLLEDYSWLACLTLKRVTFDLEEVIRPGDTFELAGLEELHLVDISPDAVVNLFVRADLPALDVLDLRFCKDLPSGLFDLITSDVRVLFISYDTPIFRLEDFLFGWQGTFLRLETSDCVEIMPLVQAFGRPVLPAPGNQAPPTFLCHSLTHLFLVTPSEFDCNPLRRLVEQRSHYVDFGNSDWRNNTVFGPALRMLCVLCDKPVSVNPDDRDWLVDHVGTMFYVGRSNLLEFGPSFNYSDV